MGYRTGCHSPCRFKTFFRATRQLIAQVEPFESGLILTLAVPNASKSTVLNVLQPILSPMADGDTGKALVCGPEAKYMVVSDDEEELAFMDDSALKLYWVSEIHNLHQSHAHRAHISVLRGYNFIPRRRVPCIAKLSIGCN